MMKKIMKFLHSKKGTVVLALVAIALLLGSVAGSTNAALTYYSENYVAEMQMTQIGVTLVETSSSKTEDISKRDYADNGNWNESQGELLKYMLEETNGKVVVNHAYKEELSVKNSGNIDSYVRMRVYKYWTKQDESGNWVKTTDLDPSLIKLHVTDGSGWIKGEETKERTYFYWPTILKSGNQTKATIDTITIDGEVSKHVTTTSRIEGNKKIYTTTYDYDGYKFNLEAEVDAVQTHNYKDAIKSAWGVDADAIGIQGGE